MRLTKVTICGYRSFKSETTVDLDSRITVLLGANDHGKTNFLKALTHLNVEEEFDEEVDLNWDEEADQGNYPRIRYFLKPEELEQKRLRAGLTRHRRLQFVSKQMDALDEESRPIADAIEELQSLIGKAADSPERIDGAENEGGSTEERLSARKAELLAKGSVRERWRSLQELISQIEDDALEKVSSDALLQRLKRKASSLQVELNDLSNSKTAREQALIAIREEGDKGKIGPAENAYRIALTKYKRAQADAEAANESVRLIELHIKYFGDTAEKEYSRMVQAVSRLAAKCPDQFVFERKGIGGELEFLDDDKMVPLPGYLEDFLPRVEVFSSVDQLPDGVSQETIWHPESRFMRGIFYYAGLNKSDWEKVFSQGDRTSKRLADASGNLNEVLRRDWRQGKELTFRLEHRGDGRIDLIIDDPKVQSTYVRISRRSSGFTHFFGLKTILHSSEIESSAASHIWLFDEPGISLHPDGQYDLLQALDTISRQNQVIYTTHSLFMIDKNYPSRHRLLAKSNDGTKVDGKPFLGNWRAAIDALGLALPGTILFATHVLLVEGASDAILLNAILQWMAKEEMHNVDINPLSIMPVGDPREADAVTRILLEASIRPRLAALYDGDQGGENRKEKLKKLLDDNKVHVTLAKDKTIEDYLPGFDDVFIPTVAEYAARTFGVDREVIQEAIVSALKDESEQAKRIDVVLDATKKAAKLGDKPSKVGIARDYAHALLEGEFKISKSDRDKLKKLVGDLQSALQLPARTTKQNQILRAD
ncbi:MAG: AAA family ATPase [Parvibaculum sp.]|nr:AAA family ATPase [Parvibaculum sp.]